MQMSNLEWIRTDPMNAMPSYSAMALATLLACSGAMVPIRVASAATAPADDGVRSAAQLAINNNPELSARAHALRAAAAAVTSARGGLYPRVDLQASVGKTNDRITTRNPEGQSLSRSGAALTLTQLLWDAQAIRSDIERLGHDQLVRWFELLDATETTALEAVRAHHDVMRQRTLLALAEDNYVEHRYAAGQIGSRVRAGVGRGVDLEQANARLALAESNLSTETANLHDVTARYLRIVGELPPDRLGSSNATQSGLPGSAAEAVTLAQQSSPAVSASIENLRAARAAVQGREGTAWQPRVEARLRSGAGRNFDGVPDQKRDTSAEIVLNWNLYNGGSDRARIRQAVDLLNQAADQRDKTCRDVRQQAAIAFNDTQKLAEQTLALDRNVLAIEKARDAYRQQFDIGQRSLLDLLNAENELYTARRALANTQVDLLLAQARTLAATQRLSVQLGLAPADIGVAPPSGWTAGDDAPVRCPSLVAQAQAGASRSELDARAQRLVQMAPSAPAAAAPAPRP